jgi:phage terminase large subunit-like protein
MIDEPLGCRAGFGRKDHEKTIVDLFSSRKCGSRTFDANVLTGSILIFALVDELHLLGRSAHTTKVLRQIRGGLDKTPEGLLLITTTQSDDRPVGAFKDELVQARKIRDGEFRGKSIRPMLPVLYEFPPEIACDPAQWENPENWRMVMPNLGRSVHLRDLAPDWQTEKSKGEHPARIWASQHLNIEIGIGLGGRWAAAEFWEAATDPTLTFESLLERSDVVVVRDR